MGAKKVVEAVCAAVAMIKIPNRKLFVSQPDPRLFGNPQNAKNDPNWTNANWLKSRFHFSFAEYRNHQNSQFGVLRVMNDDLVQPARGFGAHGHSDMEIITYIVDGELTHQDSMGTSESLGRGAVQFMSAGTGVRHSEHNVHPTEPARFIQSWIIPRKRGVTPNYGSATGEKCNRANKWAHVLSDFENKTVETCVKVHQDVNMYVTECESGISLPIKIASGRQAYLLQIEGSGSYVDTSSNVTIELERHDAMEISANSDINVTAGAQGAHILYFEMAEVAGSGRGDL